MRFLIEKWNLATKFLTPTLVTALGSMVFGGWLVLNESRDAHRTLGDLARQALRVEQQSSEQVQRRALESKADIIGRFMARTVPDLIAAYDYLSLQSYQAEATSDADVVLAAYLKPDGTPYIEFDKPAVPVLERRYPIVYEGENLGSVLLGMRLDGVGAAVAAANRRVEQALAELSASAATSEQQFVGIMTVTILGVVLLISVVLASLFRLLVVSPLEQTRLLIDHLAAGNGDLTVRLPVTSGDEISSLRNSTNRFIAQLHEMVGAIVADVTLLSRETEELRTFERELIASSERQRSETTQVSTAMTEMATTVQEVAQNAVDAAGASEKAADDAEQGHSVVSLTIQSIQALAADVESATEVIEQLRRDSDGIGAVIDVIEGIAEQTNLLALNAAIEAARAGDQGRGFAVVADEVRTLASRTQKSTEEIHRMIDSLQTGSENAVAAMARSGDRAKRTVDQAARAGISLEGINEAIARISDMNTHIAGAAEEQSAVAGKIDDNITAINSISEVTASGAERTARSSERLSDLTSRLRELVGKFRI